MDNIKIVGAIKSAGIVKLNEMQEEALHHSKLVTELVLLSPTGTGKTLAFLLSLINRMSDKNRHLQSLIIAPTRELALQTESVFKNLKSGYKITTCYGGHSISVEEKSLLDIPSIIIGTPGRILDHVQRENIFLSTVENIVLDEYDKCLEFGFQAEMESIIKGCTNRKFTMLTSATELNDLPTFLNLNDLKTIDYTHQQFELNFNYYSLEAQDKLESTIRILTALSNQLTVVFCNYRNQADEISQALSEIGIEFSLYHGGLEQTDRERALLKFRHHSNNILLCTDIGSRGLDIPEIKNIIHFELPHDIQSWTHRNGRTARNNDETENNIYIFKKDLKFKKYDLDIVFKPFDIPMQNEIHTPSWQTLYISAGKKNKLSKGDIVGFFIKIGGLENNDIGRIDVMDFQSFVAIPRSKTNQLLQNIEGKKLKGKKEKIGIAN